MEIEKFRLADNVNRECIEILSKKSQDYETHLQSILQGDASESFKNHLKQVLSMKKEMDLISKENESLKKISASHESSNTKLIEENNLLSERLNLYLRKLIT